MTRQHWSERVNVQQGDRIWRSREEGEECAEWVSVIYWCKDSYKHARSNIRESGWYRLTDYFIGVQESVTSNPNDYTYVDCWDYYEWISDAEYSLVRATKGIS